METESIQYLQMMDTWVFHPSLQIPQTRSPHPRTYGEKPDRENHKISRIEHKDLMSTFLVEK